MENHILKRTWMANELKLVLFGFAGVPGLM